MSIFHLREKFTSVIILKVQQKKQTKTKHLALKVFAAKKQTPALVAYLVLAVHSVSQLLSNCVNIFSTITTTGPYHLEESDFLFSSL